MADSGDPPPDAAKIIGGALSNILILNVDRTRARSNLFLLDGALHGCGYGSAMELRAALAGREADEDTSLREIRRHPFYRGNYDGMLFAEKTPRLILGRRLAMLKGIEGGA